MTRIRIFIFSGEKAPSHAANLFRKKSGPQRDSVPLALQQARRRQERPVRSST
jgi:hypothetical protein